MHTVAGIAFLSFSDCLQSSDGALHAMHTVFQELPPMGDPMIIHLFSVSWGNGATPRSTLKLVPAANKVLIIVQVRGTDIELTNGWTS
jgi:hypothetical protein